MRFRIDNLDPQPRHTFRVGCMGCLAYTVLFFTAGGILILINAPIILSVPIVAFFSLIWGIFFVRALLRDFREHQGDASLLHRLWRKK